jgi:hypothetical protein
MARQPAEEVEDSNLLFISKLRSSRPDVLDGENQKLQQRVSNFYVGLLPASRFAPAHRPVMLSGSRRNGAVDIRQQHDFDSPVPCIFRGYPPVVNADIQLAVRLAGEIEDLGTAPLKGGHWRLFRTLDIYRDTRTVRDILDRLHQYARCIDGLILPDAGKTKQQFKSRTELFIGPRHHDLMGDIYDVRSAVEHLHDNRYLEGFVRATDGAGADYRRPRSLAALCQHGVPCIFLGTACKRPSTDLGRSHQSARRTHGLRSQVHS